MSNKERIPLRGPPHIMTAVHCYGHNHDQTRSGEPSNAGIRYPDRVLLIEFQAIDDIVGCLP